MKRIAVLGSTGSIGRSTLSVVESYPERFEVVSLAAGKNVEAALEQAKRWRPRVVSLRSERDADQLRNQLKAAGLPQTHLMHAPSGTLSVATHPAPPSAVSPLAPPPALPATPHAARARTPAPLAHHH